MFDGRTMSLYLLLSLAINYPVLKDWGLEMPKLLILAVDTGEQAAAVKLLAKSDTPRLDGLTNNKAFISTLLQTNSDFVLCSYSRSRRGLELVEKLCSIMKTGTVNGTPFTALPLVIVEGFPAELMEKEVFTIFMEGNLEDLSIKRRDVIPPDNQLEVVLDKIRTVTREANSWDEQGFLSAACFLYPNLVSAGHEEKFDDFVFGAKQLVELNENNLSLAGLDEAFIQALYQWQERTAFSEIYELPYIDMDVGKRVERCMFYNDEFLFMKDRLFKAVVGSLLQVFPTNGLKTALVNSGILCPDNASTYTAKMPFYNVAGQYQRERMLRFRRSRLNMLGEMDFVEICLGWKEDERSD